MNRAPTSAGLLIVAAGVIIVAAGLLFMAGGLSWLGHLPGDIRIEREHLRLYVPITSMLLVSIGLSIAAYVLGRIFGGR